ncbi:MAG: acyl-CoA dehydrogenase family protein [Chitinophagales bacterium]|nr:acyl-CoA dehydrogenase family protein [Chitinophagales bacterium]MDW8419226.1 acyl-CoA dehydrogenase family protein [Chitinophagales bacterium]
MPSPFTPEHQLLRESFRQFVETEIKPHVAEWEANKICDREVFRKMGERGFFGVSFPEEYGGSGMDMWSAVVISEELTKANVGGLAMSLYAHTYLPLPAICALGTEEQKQKYLVPALRGEKIAALGITEPGAGSDVGGITTTAEDKGDHFVVNGSKMFITNGTLADFILLAVRTGEGHNLSLLIFDTDTPGFSATPVHNKLGMHTSDTGQLYFHNCQVPKSALLGQKDMGFYYIMNNFQEERLIAAITGTASAEHALEKAKRYMHERQAFGRPIAKFQVLRHKIAKMAITVEACRSLSYRAVQEFIEQGPAAYRIISMAKAFVCEEAFYVVNEALQIHGGWGYMEDYGIARSLRDIRLMTVGAGTTEIMHEIISKIELDNVKHEKQLLKTRT